MACLLGSVFGSVVAIRAFERRYPLDAGRTRSATVELDAIDGAADAPQEGKPEAPPAWLDGVMGLVYPASLGLDEAIAHLSMKQGSTRVRNSQR